MHRERMYLMIYFERAKKGHRQSDQHWNCSEGNTREASERWDRVCWLSQVCRYHIEVNRTAVCKFARG